MSQPLLWMLAASLGGLLVGIAAGFYLGRGTAADARRLRELRRELDTAGSDFAAFRKQVQRHFVETATLAGQLGASQRALHEHLARGAHALAGQVLEQPPDPEAHFPVREAPARSSARAAVAAAPAPTRSVAEADSAPAHPAMVAPVDFPRS